MNDLRADIEENGMPESVAAANFAKWYTETIPASEDPFIMSEQDAAHIVKQFLATRKLPSGMKPLEARDVLSSNSSAILMRD